MISIFSYSQNLVPNGSFEKWKEGRKYSKTISLLDMNIKDLGYSRNGGTVEFNPSFYSYYYLNEDNGDDSKVKPIHGKGALISTAENNSCFQIELIKELPENITLNVEFYFCYNNYQSRSYIEYLKIGIIF